MRNLMYQGVVSKPWKPEVTDLHCLPFLEMLPGDYGDLLEIILGQLEYLAPPFDS